MGVSQVTKIGQCMTETELSQSLPLPGTVLANPSANAMTARENSLNINGFN